MCRATMGMPVRVDRLAVYAAGRMCRVVESAAIQSWRGGQWTLLRRPHGEQRGQKVRGKARRPMRPTGGPLFGRRGVCAINSPDEVPDCSTILSANTLEGFDRRWVGREGDGGEEVDSRDGVELARDERE